MTVPFTVLPSPDGGPCQAPAAVAAKRRCRWCRGDPAQRRALSRAAQDLTASPTRAYSPYVIAKAGHAGAVCGREWSKN